MVKYRYGMGNCTISSKTTDYTIANANPIRYRGYYYDSDTGLYYCNARYYSPKWRRFISPDDTAYLDPKSSNGLNLYCYCCNDPVNCADPSGHVLERVQKINSIVQTIAGLIAQFNAVLLFPSTVLKIAGASTIALLAGYANWGDIMNEL